MENLSIAYELLRELKHTNKRIFIICIVEAVIIVSMVIGFFVYESQYNLDGETYQYVDDTNLTDSNLEQNIGE
jgi:capsular polysaccharide biosynthesis protein